MPSVVKAAIALVDVNFFGIYPRDLLGSCCSICERQDLRLFLRGIQNHKIDA